MTIEDRANSGKRASRTGRLDATLDRISLDSARSLALLIVLGVVALTWIVFVGVILLGRSAPAPETVSALPPLAVSLPPLPEVESKSHAEVPVEPGASRKPEVVPINPGVPHEAGPEHAHPAASTPVRVQEEDAAGARLRGSTPPRG
ncbi:MAG: hypothetical protein JO288_09485 [Hyphomicrobiales bacterium]|nr:hypothetical protein [Hyphomicrobiales bacterium]